MDSSPVRLILYEPPDHNRLRFFKLPSDPGGAGEDVLESQIARQDAYTSYLPSGDSNQLERIVPYVSYIQKSFEPYTLSES